MDATVLQPCKILFPPPPRFCRRFAMQKHLRRPRCSPIKSVITDDNNLATSLSTRHQSKNVYNDTWFDRLAINHLSHSLQSATGLISKKSGYDGLVEAATMASRQFNPIQQRQLVILALQTAFPSLVLSLIKRLLPPSKFAREYFATFTTVFFAWLVGPCQVKESEFGGKREKNVVHIPKCRFLEGTSCVGMCTNLCKMPSQTFIKESLGMPINMVPNFDDMSCEMRFGEEPPPQSLDPAFKQPCFKHCNAIKEHRRNCTT